jgi:hypothetical protein
MKLKITQRLVRDVIAQSKRDTHTFLAWALINSEEHGAISYAIYANPHGSLADIVADAKSALKLGI